MGRRKRINEKAESEVICHRCNEKFIRAGKETLCGECNHKAILKRLKERKPLKSPNYYRLQIQRVIDFGKNKKEVKEWLRFK